VRRLRWDQPDRERRLPEHPYRDSAVLYAVLAIIVVIVAAATGGGVVRAIVFAVVAFLLATAWSWRTWRSRERAERMRKAERGE
jgi:Flp pilus assembly protein TadB